MLLIKNLISTTELLDSNASSDDESSISTYIMKVSLAVYSLVCDDDRIEELTLSLITKP